MLLMLCMMLRDVAPNRGLDMVLNNPGALPTAVDGLAVGLCMSVVEPRSVFETMASSQSYPGRQATRRTG